MTNNQNPLDLVSSLHFEYFWRGYAISSLLIGLAYYFDANTFWVVWGFLVLGVIGVKYSQYMREKHDN